MKGVILAASAMQLGGCAVVPWGKEPGVGFVVTNINGDPTPYYVMYERGWEKLVYSASAAWWGYWWYLPFAAVEGGMMGDHLFDYSVQWWDCLAPYEMAWGPRKQSVGTIMELAEWMSPAQFWVGKEQQNEVPQQWILGNEPMVIALGTDKVKLAIFFIQDDLALVLGYCRVSNARVVRHPFVRGRSTLLPLDKWGKQKQRRLPHGPGLDAEGNETN